MMHLAGDGVRPARFREFEGWLRRIDVETRVCNPTEKILWNFEKHYLMDLQKRGIAIIPTVYFPANSGVFLYPTDLNWPDVVAKPSIGGSSFAVRRFSIELNRTQIDIVLHRSTRP
jgi:hypothetical protein